MSRKLVSLYRNLIKNNLTLYNALQTGVLMGAGDVIAQKVVEKKSWENFDVTRTARFFALGAAFVGPTISTWYRFLDKKFTSQAGQLVNKKHALFKKVACDQLLFAPTFIVAIVTAINTTEGKSMRENQSELREKYPDILLANYKLWPWVQLVNFYYVPLQHQVLVVQTVALVWNTYISWKTHTTTEKENDTEKIFEKNVDDVL